VKLPGLQYDSPVRFTRKQRVKLALLPPLIAHSWITLIRLNRFELRGREHLDEALSAHGHGIIAFWHESIALDAYACRGMNYHATASYSFDGELAARMASRFGVETVRGSSSRGGMKALAELEKALTLVPCVGITLDGPRGPRRTSKPGIAMLAARTGIPILPLVAALTRRKRLRSWDRVPIPLPFGQIVAQWGPPIAPPADQTRESIEATRLEVEQKMNALQEALEQELGDDPER